MSDLDRLSAQALAALNVTAWLSPGAIPRELLPAPHDAAGVQSELLGRGLLVEHPDGGCALPEVIRGQVREAFGDQGRDHALMAMRDFLGAPGSPGETARCVALVPHLTYWTSQTRAEEDFVDGALVLNRVVVLLLENEMGAVAVPLAERFARTCELHIGPRKPVPLIAESNLAAAYDQAGEHVRGARRLEKVADARAAAFGPDDPSVWDAYNNLGGIYMSAGEYDRAAGIVERIITHRTATLGPDHRATLMARNNLAVIRDRAGRTDEAIALWREMLPEFEAALGTGDTDTLAIRSALFRALRRHHGTKGPRDPSEIEAIVARLSENSGEGTQQTVAALVERATLLRDQGRLEEAEAAFLEAIEKGRRTLGSGHPVVVSAQYRIALVHEARDHISLALAAAEAALAEADRSLGPTHHETLMAAACVLVFLLRLDRLEDHRTMLEARLADVIVGLGFSHPLVRALAAHRASLALRQPHWG